MNSDGIDMLSGMKTFPEKLLQLIRRNGWSQAGFQAEISKSIAGVSKSKVSNWVNGVYAPDLDEIRAIARLFGVSADFLAFDEYEEPGASLLTEDQKYLLRTVENLSLTADDVARILWKSVRPETEKAAGGEEVISPTAAVKKVDRKATRKQSPKKKG